LLLRVVYNALRLLYIAPHARPFGGQRGRREVSKPANDFRDAADELAAEFLSRQFPDSITADDARKYVDAGVLAAWTEIEATSRDENIILGDMCSQRCDAATARSLICALAVGYADKVQQMLQEALIDQVSRDLAYEATRLVENHEPPAPASLPYQSRRMDDDYGDWLHERRKQDRLDAEVQS